MDTTLPEFKTDSDKIDYLLKCIVDMKKNEGKSQALRENQNVQNLSAVGQQLSDDFLGWWKANARFVLSDARATCAAHFPDSIAKEPNGNRRHTARGKAINAAKEKAKWRAQKALTEEAIERLNLSTRLGTWFRNTASDARKHLHSARAKYKVDLTKLKERLVEEAKRQQQQRNGREEAKEPPVSKATFRDELTSMQKEAILEATREFSIAPDPDLQAKVLAEFRKVDDVTRLEAGIEAEMSKLRR